MKLYLAAPWVDRDKMEAIAQRFEAHGHKITCKWWATEEVLEGLGANGALKIQAMNDKTGVENCDLLVVFNTSKSEGKAVEQGLAIAMNKPILAIGKLGDGTAKNVFHYLPNYRWVDDVDGALRELETIQWLVDNGA